MLPEAHLDFETSSTTDLLTAGVHRYAEDINTSVWCFSWCIGDGPVNRWKEGDPDPIPLLHHIAHGGVIKAHNAIFERTIWNQVLRKAGTGRCSWPAISVTQQDCTMARAAAVSRPQSLDMLCQALNTEDKKDIDGHKLMMKMSSPRRFNADSSITWWGDSVDVERLQQYCDQDVKTECAIDKIVPALTPSERRVWELDQLINDRGICIDVKAARKCAALVELAKKSADSEMRRLTGRMVPKCSTDKKIVEWIQSRGIDCSTVKKDVQDDLIFVAQLRGDDVVEEVIRLRADSKKTSTAKFAAMIECVCADGRVRGTLNYHGAGPGRWAGRLIQPQNFPRVDHEKEGYIFEWMAELLDSDATAQDVFDLMRFTARRARTRRCAYCHGSCAPAS